MKKFQKYFFINKQLHRKLLIDRTNDRLYAWNFITHTRNVYTLSDTLRRMEPAFSSRQVAQMIGRDKTVIERAIWGGIIPTPQQTYSLETRAPGKYMWHEDDIIHFHDYLSGVHYGRPRNDGIIVPRPMPTRRELRAMIANREVLEVKPGEKYVPSWKANG